ncbi:Peptidase M23 OS=Tsukamurella paurometabola (strain ATCC 8368 / DSM / CCUG 35730 / CIP 100753/ JCM 10117 / KCTC 9821 / NBRC 16120 / NCIMB 702349 / NCTC 13040) OX=521096 GN=Tpau_1657 PE=4 SV=1 [Tsukamurella paurometabola]|uniref:Peptidase M23 n=1 Tax=Tsukamurella paurometabola (strain ATCC 8368 / DSM 20162 / CCUG 35730 / CIP 100753 / JCM 10117 / KCTC 9821 / NBRC 16120 / NCIMB 702349 / NCTC 13040) TaxID=521096 RepID=D5UYH0_TSUPD|nr:M23 family metallopeptidase [Tsukamurella paurometabola]ADG78277.1 Peptidase M23 [Tsukamurella paurometabola DSM 20162]SUP30994.1 Peptidase family M23 [Tsukamurella paurometabola]
MRIIAGFLLCLLLPAATPVRAASEYAWPLDPRPAVARPFANPDERWQPGHRGVDLAGSAGQTVHAAGAGRVHHVGRVDDRIVISVLHPNGLLTTYEPITESGVAEGDEVTVGTALGTLAAGHPGCPVAVCLHWGLRRGSGHAARYFNPLLLVGAAPVRLLPDAGAAPSG